MATFTNRDYTWDRHGVILKALKSWHPRDVENRTRHPSTEKEWKHSFKEHLRKCLPDARVDVERMISGRQGDVAIQFESSWGWSKVKDVVELKVADSLGSGRNFDGLRTQIQDYLKDENANVFVVLCGREMDEKYPRALKDQYDKWRNTRLSIFWKKGFESGDVRAIVLSRSTAIKP
jgi:hypothetical protein